MTGYLNRYLAGEYHAVWRELIELGESALQPPVLEQATEVAEEIVRRVIFNAEIVGRYLADAGYEFDTPGPFVVPANAETAQDVQQIEREYGRLPLILKVWWRQVDHVNLLPSEWQLNSGRGCPTEGISPTGEIMIKSPRDCLEMSHKWVIGARKTWEALLAIDESTSRTADPNVAFLPLGPATSGNEPVGYRFPVQAVDAECYDDREEMPEEERISRSIVDWLRYWYLSRGGLAWIFLGCVPTADGGREWRGFIRPKDEIEKIVQSMNLIPF